MSRLPYLGYDDLDADGRQVWDGVVGSRLGELVNDRGGLIGPFNAFVHAPGVGRRLSSLGGKLRFATSIEPRLIELAIITVGAHWKAEFERAIYAVASQLARTGQLDQGAYDAAQRLLGDAGMVELVSLCGYYTLISYLLNAFAVPLPDGVTPFWGGSD
jgi:4-carboxymuconolactone decarboxylase